MILSIKKEGSDVWHDLKMRAALSIRLATDRNVLCVIALLITLIALITYVNGSTIVAVPLLVLLILIVCYDITISYLLFKLKIFLKKNPKEALYEFITSFVTGLTGIKDAFQKYIVELVFKKTLEKLSNLFLPSKLRRHIKIPLLGYIGKTVYSRHIMY